MFRKRTAVHKYCDVCSEKRDLERKKKWAQTHKPKPNMEKIKKYKERVKSDRIERGRVKNQEILQSINWFSDCQPELIWFKRVAVPFSYAFSKNHIWAMSQRGHVFMRKDSAMVRENLTKAIAGALGDQKVVTAKVWLDILVQKPDHKGDAVNVIDLVCDAVKDAIGLDDRWFSIRTLDWEISKNNPMIYVGIGQDTDVEHRICSYCGRILTLDYFTGKSRECKECKRVAS